MFDVDCRTIHCTLCVCVGSCEVLELCSLGTSGTIFRLIFLDPISFFLYKKFKTIVTGFGQSRTFASCSWLWFMAFYGFVFRNSSNFYPRRLLLLLHSEVSFCHFLFIWSQQTNSFSSHFILICSVFGGQLVLRLPSGVV